MSVLWVYLSNRYSITAWNASISQNDLQKPIHRSDIRIYSLKNKPYPLLIDHLVITERKPINNPHVSIKDKLMLRQCISVLSFSTDTKSLLCHTLRVAHTDCVLNSAKELMHLKLIWTWCGVLKTWDKMHVQHMFTQSAQMEVNNLRKWVKHAFKVHAHLMETKHERCF